MPSPQQTRAAVPLDQQSVLPAVRGVPWWGAVLLAVVITGIGAALDASRNDGLDSTYKFFYLVGCVAAALAVRRRALFTAAAQPPLIGFGISMIALYELNKDLASKDSKNFIFKVLLPIAADFPWMAITFVVTLILVLARWYLTRGPGTDKGSGRSSESRAAKTADKSTKASDAERSRPARRPAGGERKRTTRSRTEGTSDAATSDRPRERSARATRPSGTSSSATPRPRPARPSRPSSASATATATAVGEDPRPRATAGQVYRTESGHQIRGEESGTPSATTGLASYRPATGLDTPADTEVSGTGS